MIITHIPGKQGMKKSKSMRELRDIRKVGTSNVFRLQRSD